MLKTRSVEVPGAKSKCCLIRVERDHAVTHLCVLTLSKSSVMCVAELISCHVCAGLGRKCDESNESLAPRNCVIVRRRARCIVVVVVRILV